MQQSLGKLFSKGFVVYIFVHNLEIIFSRERKINIDKIQINYE